MIDSIETLFVFGHSGRVDAGATGCPLFNLSGNKFPVVVAEDEPILEEKSHFRVKGEIAMLISMMKPSRKQVASLVIVCLTSLQLQAGLVPGRWEKVSTLPVASPITVELKDGDRIKGHYEGLSVTDVMLVTHFSRAVIPKKDIEAITTQPEDNLSNGTLIGAGVGAGLMGVWAAAASSDLSALGAVWMLTTGLAIGAGLGAVGDAIEKPEPIVLYEAP